MDGLKHHGFLVLVVFFVSGGVEVFVDDFVGKGTPSFFMVFGYFLKIDLSLWLFFGLIFEEVVIQLLHGLVLLQQLLVIIQQLLVLLFVIHLLWQFLQVNRVTSLYSWRIVDG